jgi:hypothetical protein
MGSPSLPRTADSSTRLTLPSSGEPKPRSHNPNAHSRSSGRISVSSHVAAQSGVKSLTTGFGSKTHFACSAAMPLLMSLAYCADVNRFGHGFFGLSEDVVFRFIELVIRK